MCADKCGLESGSDSRKSRSNTCLHGCDRGLSMKNHGNSTTGILYGEIEKNFKKT